MNSILSTVSAVADIPQETNLLTIATKGGFLMIILLIISLIAIYIIIERLLQFKKVSKTNDEFLPEVELMISKGQLDRAIKVCREEKSNPLARVIARIIDYHGQGFLSIKDILEAAVQKELVWLERKLGTLSTFAAIAPLLGFLGTVTGMVKVFMKLGETGGAVDITLLANGIWEALITTVGGLTVGIICILFHNYLIGKVENIVNALEDRSNAFLVNFKKEN